MKLKYIVFTAVLSSGVFGFSFSLRAQQDRSEYVPYGDMNAWMVRIVDESFVIGGNRKYLYEITPGDTLKNNMPYKAGVSPWATSSVMARVSGVVKASVTVFPEKRGNGYCARLETRMEHVKVLGLLNLSVLATGTIFLGEVQEPIKDTKDPQGKLNSGIVFSRRPQALEFDYKTEPGGHQVKATGFSRILQLPEQNNAEACLLLQHRWEDAAGNVYAKRIGTAYERYDSAVREWQNAHRIPVHYGDISKASFYRPYMGLTRGEESQYCLNSKGKMVPIQEVGWGSPGEKVTHLIIRFSSGHGGPYIGAPESKFWVDNVRLRYGEE